MMHFTIVGKADPLYETVLTPLKNKQSTANSNDAANYLHQFVLHSSLDMVQSAMDGNNSTYLKVVDRFNNSQVSAYVTPGGATFLLLHNGKSEDIVRYFFIEAHELYVKHILNPLIQLDAPIVSPRFDELINLAARKLYQ
jgi:trafficking protein particle complex subunit 2